MPNSVFSPTSASLHATVSTKGLRRRALALVVVAHATVLFASFCPAEVHAAGATAYTYSPIFCQTFGGTLFRWNQGQIGNGHSSETMHVYCPLIHEEKHNHSGKLEIKVIDASRDHKVECRAYFNHPHASEDPPWNGNGWHGTLGSGPTNKVTIVLPGANYLGGSNLIYCKLPPKDFHFVGEDGVSRIGAYKSGVD
jgi:hypothetical protein